jgi:hypothetical protein
VEATVAATPFPQPLRDGCPFRGDNEHIAVVILRPVKAMRNPMAERCARLGRLIVVAAVEMNIAAMRAADHDLRDGNLRVSHQAALPSSRDISRKPFVC